MTSSADQARSKAASCEGKRGFDSRKTAIDVMTRSNRKLERSRSAYRCLWCCRWHLGSDPSGIARRSQAAIKRRKQGIADEIEE